MGSEVAGEIVGLGKDVTEFKVTFDKPFVCKRVCLVYWFTTIQLGDRVLALPKCDAWSEYVVCHVDLCFKIPEKMNYHEAVALTFDGILAYSVLFQIGDLSPGEAVLMHFTGGGLVNFRLSDPYSFNLTF